MEDFLINAIQGIIGASPVAAVLVWRLVIADRRAKEQETRTIELTDKWIGFLTNMKGGKKSDA